MVAKLWLILTDFKQFFKLRHLKKYVILDNIGQRIVILFELENIIYF